jgi:hypothetical protein
MKFFVFEGWKRPGLTRRKMEGMRKVELPTLRLGKHGRRKKAPEAHRSALLPSVPFVKQFSVLAVEPERLETTFRKGFG